MNMPKKNLDDFLAERLMQDFTGVADGASGVELDEKELYNYHYNRIYPLLKEGRLDFPKIAEKTGLKERRIRETLMFRLTSEVLQLFGRQEGFCYVCTERLFSQGNKEPMCLPCLQAIDRIAQELQPPPSKARPQTSGSVDKSAPEGASEARASGRVIPFEQYQQVLEQLNRYQEKYGLLDDEPETGPGSGDAVPDASGDALAADGDGVALMEILALESDEELNLEALSEDLPTQQEQPIRHFGFQRLRSKS